MSKDVEFRRRRELARQYGDSPLTFEAHCRTNDLIREDEQLCHECWEPRAKDLFGSRQPHVCVHCVNAASARRRAKTQSKSLDGATNYGQPWSEKDDRYITDHPELTDRELAATLGRSYHAVRRHREIMGLLKREVQIESPSGPIFHFTEHRDVVITRITVDHHVEGEIKVWCNTNATKDELQAKFIADGVGLDIFELWWTRRIAV